MSFDYGHIPGSLALRSRGTALHEEAVLAPVYRLALFHGAEHRLVDLQCLRALNQLRHVHLWIIYTVTEHRVLPYAQTGQLNWFVQQEPFYLQDFYV